MNAIRASEIREGAHITFQLVDETRTRRYGAEAPPIPARDGEIWSRGPAASTWWVKPDDEPNRPIVVRLKEIVAVHRARW